MWGRVTHTHCAMRTAWNEAETPTQTPNELMRLHNESVVYSMSHLMWYVECCSSEIGIIWRTQIVRDLCISLCVWSALVCNYNQREYQLFTMNRYVNDVSGWVCECVSEWVSESVIEWVCAWMSESVIEWVCAWMSESVIEWVCGWLSEWANVRECEFE